MAGASRNEFRKPTLASRNSRQNKMDTHDPQSLTRYPGRPKINAWGDDDPRFEAFCDDVKLRGVVVPICLVGTQIVDGDLRWRAAKRMQLTEIPAIQIDPDDALLCIMQNLAQRKHFTKGAIAYLLYPFLKPAFEHARKRQTECRANISPASSTYAKNPGSVLRTLPLPSETVESFATKLGLNRRLIFQAQEVHKLLEKFPQFRDEIEARILAEDEGGQLESRPMGLGAARAGIASLEAAAKRGGQGGGVPDDISRQLELFSQARMDEAKRWGYWKNIDEDGRRAHFKEFLEFIGSDDFTAEDVEEMSAYHAKISTDLKVIAREKRATAE